MNLNVKFMISDIPTVLGALPVTLELTFASLFFAILLAVLFGVCILKKIPVLKQLVIGLNTFIKGVPLIVQLLFCYYALPYVLRAFDGVLGYTYDPKHPSYFGFAVVAFCLQLRSLYDGCGGFFLQSGGQRAAGGCLLRRNEHVSGHVADRDPTGRGDLSSEPFQLLHVASEGHQPGFRGKCV